MTEFEINKKAAELCGIEYNIITEDVKEPFISAINEHTWYSKFDMFSNPADKLLVIDMLNRNMFSIRATDGGTGRASYTEDFDTWSPGYENINDALSSAIETLSGKSKN